MKALILSSNYNSYSNKSLINSLKKFKIQTLIVDPLDSFFEFSGEKSQYYYNGKSLTKPQIVIPRMGWQTYQMGLNLLCQFDTDEVPILNSISAIEICHNKLRAAQFLKKNSFDIPNHFFASSTVDAKEYFNRLGKYKYLKSLSGSQGFGVSWGQNTAHLKSLVDLLRNSQTPHILQNDLSKNQEYRSYLLGGKVLTTIKKDFNEGRNNYSQLTIEEKKKLEAGKPFTLPKKIQQELVRLQKELVLDFSAIDYFVSRNSAVIIDINCFPGFEYVQGKMGINIADPLAAYIAKKSAK